MYVTVAESRAFLRAWALGLAWSCGALMLGVIVFAVGTRVSERSPSLEFAVVASVLAGAGALVAGYLV